MSTIAEIDTLIAGAKAGDRRALARLLTRVEDGAEGTSSLIGEMFRIGTAGVVGITGPPGAGKSTLTDRLVAASRSHGVAPVAVLAVDPSSPFTGGAILGDRIRMQSHASDLDVFIRSMATRGRLGGMATATPKVVALLSGLGFEEIFVETVGVGQAEVDIAATATTTVVVLPANFGDGVQASKAGLLEVGDLFVVNQADRPGADESARRLTEMLSLAGHRAWMPPVVSTVATTGEGVEEVSTQISAHRSHLAESGTASGGVRTAGALLLTALEAELSSRAESLLATPRGSALVADVAARSIDPWTAARELGGSGDG